jgi:hypothetical protein
MDDLLGGIAELVGGIFEVGAEAVDAVADVAEVVVDVLAEGAEVVEGVAEVAIDAVGDVAIDAGAELVNAAGNAADVVGTGIGDVAGGVAEVASNTADAVGASDALSAAGDVVNVVSTDAAEVAGAVVKAVPEAGLTAFDMATDFLIYQDLFGGHYSQNMRDEKRFQAQQLKKYEQFEKKPVTQPVKPKPVSPNVFLHTDENGKHYYRNVKRERELARMKRKVN